VTEPISPHERFATLPGRLAPLGYRNFSLYLLGFFVSNIGRWVELTGAVWLAYELTGSPLLLGLIGIARAVPAILLSPIAGVVADRVDQRRLLQLELVNALFGMSPVMITIIGREVLAVGPEGLGGLLSAPALGSLVGIGIVLGLGQPRRQGRFLVIASIANAGIFVLFALAGTYVLSFVALIGIGCTDALIGVTRQSMAHLAAPGRMRGRVMANMGTVTRGVSPLAETQAGVLSSLMSGPAAVITAAVALAVTAAWTGRTNPALWRFVREDRSVADAGRTPTVAPEAPTRLPGPDAAGSDHARDR
jgi:hypothetical protein